MKTFEERLNAWMEGRLTGGELQSFERELESRPIPEDEPVAASELGTLLRTHLQAPRLGNEDFFNLQLMAKIAAGDGSGKPTARRFSFHWALPHLAWAGICSLVLSFALYRSWVVPSQLEHPLAAATPINATLFAEKYDARVIQVKAADSSISATALHSKKDGVTVLWLDGLDYLSEQKDLQ